METGRALGVDLFELWHAGEDLVPQVADQVKDAAGPLGAARSDGGWFRWCDVGIGGSYGAGASFGDLADTLASYLGKTQQNLYAVGDALVVAANTYDQADREAVEEFDRRKREWSEIEADIADEQGGN